MIDVTAADVMDWLPTLADESATACFCDPPYGLSFMGKSWDHGVPSTDVWREVLRVLKPGGLLLAFGGTRTWHRLAVNIEDAGFELFDTFMWVYGQGFPKSTNIGKMIDKEEGAEREVVGEYDSRNRYDGGQRSSNGTYAKHITGEKTYGPTTATAPATLDAATWDGYGTAAKPAWEPCLMFRKPRRATYAQTAVQHGTGALNIDGARVSGIDPANEKRLGKDYTTNGTNFSPMVQQVKVAIVGGNPSGRWPANLGLVHDAECRRVGTVRVASNGRNDKAAHSTGPGYDGGWQQEPRRWNADPDGLETIDAWECTDTCAVRLLGEQSGERPGATSNSHRNSGVCYGDYAATETLPGYNDTGTAARFFYQAKASRREREAGLEGMEAKATGVFDDDAYVWPMNGDGSPRNKKVQPSRNHHPTVKPLAVCEYMARLILPPEAYRDDAVLLVPYAGSGSEMIGAFQAGWRNVIGCELEPEYVEIARRRIDHWCKQPALLDL